MKFNKNQKEGIAKVFENIGAAIAVATILGALIDTKVSIYDGMALVIVVIAAVAISVLLRSNDGGDS